MLASAGIGLSWSSPHATRHRPSRQVAIGSRIGGAYQPEIERIYTERTNGAPDEMNLTAAVNCEARPESVLLRFYGFD
jgi:hypothetical protein